MTPSIPLSTLSQEIDQHLQIHQIQDYSNAINGLQLENRSGQVCHLGAAVDASLPVIQEAVRRGIDLLLVHHGMYWQGLQPLTSHRFQKIQTAYEGNLAIYSAHLPLDVHPEIGNNILLGRALGLPDSHAPFLVNKNFAMGLRWNIETPRSELHERLKSVLVGPVHFCPGGPEMIQKIGIVTGGAGSEIEKAASEGVDTFITGEGPHWSYPLAEELGINLFYGGHYATETFGVKALAQHLSLQHHLPWQFIDHPTGL